MSAGALLDNEVVGSPVVREWKDDVLAQLSGRWGVSREAVLRRLVELRRSSFDFYLRKREEYLAAYAEQGGAARREWRPVRPAHRHGLPGAAPAPR